MTDDRHIGQLYEVTGPRLLTFDDVARDLSAATARPVRYTPVSAAEFVAGLRAVGVPDDDAEGLAALFSEVLDGRSAYLTDGVERALGRPARDFAEYAKAAAATGVWDDGAVA